jgi:hypothetical protein
LKKRYTPEEIVAKLRQVDVLVSQSQNIADAIRQIGVSEVACDELLDGEIFYTLREAQIVKVCAVSVFTDQSHCMSVGCLGGAIDASSASASDIGLD